MADKQFDAFESFFDHIISKKYPELKIPEKQFNLFEEVRDLADEIIRSNRTFLNFLTSFKKFLITREECTNLMEEQHKIITKSLKKSERKSERTTAQSETVNVVSRIDIPNPNLLLIGGIFSVLYNVYAYFFDHTLSKNDVRVQILKIRETLEKDNSLVCNLFSCGIICKTQLSHTRGYIKKFLKMIQGKNWKREDFEEDQYIFNFLTNLSKFNPNHLEDSYATLKCCFNELIKQTNGNELKKANGENSNSEKKCSSIFDCAPHAIEVFDYLPWEFDTQNFDFDERKTLYIKLKNILSEGEKFDVERYLDLIEEYILRLKEEKRILNSAVMKLMDAGNTTLIYQQLGEDIVEKISQL